MSAHTRTHAVSLLVAYRDRPDHLHTLISRLALDESILAGTHELVLVEGSHAPTAQWVEELPWAQYKFVPHTGPFALARLRNQAASLARGSFVVPFDVDLLPTDGVLARHYAIAATSPNILAGGYRLQLPDDFSASADDSLDPTALGLHASALCAEDSQSALFKYLAHGERFGVCVHMPRDLFLAVNGYDEAFVGWGAEDADLLERLCIEDGRTLARCYDLLYMHQDHSLADDWNDQSLTTANRERYYAKRRARMHTDRPQ